MVITIQKKVTVQLWLTLVALLCFTLTSPLFAQTSSSATAISQGFKTQETQVVPGTLVSLKSGNQDTVELATTSQSPQLIGVVGQNPLIALSSNNSEVQVVTSGTANVLVSDINGEIKTGDKITASPIEGVGMVASDSVTVVGTAQSSFNTQQATVRTVTDISGVKHNVHIGLLAVQVNVAFYVPPDTTKSIIPSFLQQLANSIAGGQQVSVARVIASLLVLILAFVSIGVMLAASVRSSIISIGRNPLSQGAVNKSLFEVGFTAIGILLGSLAAIYLILRI